MTGYENILKRLFINKVKYTRTLNGSQNVKIIRVLTPAEEQARAKCLKAVESVIISLRNENYLSARTAKRLYAIVNGIGPRKMKSLTFPFDVTSMDILKEGSRHGISKLIKYLDDLDHAYGLEITKTDRAWLADEYSAQNVIYLQNHKDAYVPFRSEREQNGKARLVNVKFKSVTTGGLKHNQCPEARSISAKLRCYAKAGMMEPEVAIELYRIVNRIKASTMLSVTPSSMSVFYPRKQHSKRKPLNPGEMRQREHDKALSAFKAIIAIIKARQKLDLGEFDREFEAYADRLIPKIAPLLPEYAKYLGGKTDNPDLMSL